MALDERTSTVPGPSVGPTALPSQNSSLTGIPSSKNAPRNGAIVVAAFGLTVVGRGGLTVVSTIGVDRVVGAEVLTSVSMGLPFSDGDGLCVRVPVARPH